MSKHTTPALRILKGFVIAGICLLAMAYIVSHRLGQLNMPLKELGLGGAPVTTDDMHFPGQPLPVLADAMPEFANVSAWLNSEALTPEQLKGKVVLIDFWTYSCINCIRTMPYLTQWYEKYKDLGFVIVGVHTPEFAFEKDRKNVEAAIKRHGITYPVAMDNDYGTWNNYSNRYWPAHYLFDAKGQLRETHFGEGMYEETEHAIQELLSEAGQQVIMDPVDVESRVDFSRIGTPETYIGYERQEFFGSPESVARDADKNYSIPEILRLNNFALLGTWRLEGERAVLADGAGAIANHFKAANANLVMGAPNEVRAEVFLNGQPVPANKRGADVYEENGRTYVKVHEQRLYDLIDTRGQYGTEILRLEFEDDGVECYAYTFG